MTPDRRIRFGFLVLTLAPIILGWLAWRSARGMVEAREDVARTNDIINQLEILLSGLKDVEVAQREYILTGDGEYVLHMREARKSIDDQVNKLGSMHTEKYWIEILRTVIPQKFDEIAETISKRQSGGFKAASNVILRDRGSQAMDDIRRSINAMISQENENLKKRAEQQKASFDAAGILFVTVLLFSAAMIGLLFYMTQREARELERRVALRTEELQRSNEDLQQFAYVASHDMKEPLRMISSYASLLQRRYQGRLGEDADTYIGFIVDGVKRMNLLITDLLDYSRAGQAIDEQIIQLDPTPVLNGVLENLKVTIADAGATITRDPLPVVAFDPMRLAQLLQNLIGNAIKYRGDKKPVIHISARQTSDATVFSVADNGPGIPAEYHESIFGIFQRLHGKEVEGTGIGLAMCRRIVERHGGRIWVESEPGAGADFKFTVPHVQPAVNTASV